MKIVGLSALSKKVIDLYGQTNTLASLDVEEVAFLEDNFNKLLATTDSQVRKIFEERADTIVSGVMAIKEKLERRKFRGMNPSDAEIGMGFIRPGYTKTANVINTSWSVALTAMGTWDTWLSGAGGVGGYSLPEDFGLIITHFTSLVTPAPFVRTAHWIIGRVDLIPEDVTDILLGDNLNGVAVFPIPTKIILPEDELRVRLEGETGTEILKLGGLVVGLGRFIKTEDLVTLAW